MNKSAIFLFTKSPVSPNIAKTRIARVLGDKKALSIHKAFLKDIIETLNTIGNTDKYVSCTQEGSSLFDKYKDFGVFYQKDIQRSSYGISTYVSDITFSFNHLFKLGYEKVISLHADCPDLPKKYIENAVEKLNTNDFVLGPTEDGGFYLFGLKKFIPELFYSVRHGTNDALKDIRQLPEKIGVKMYETQIWYDIDTVEDLQNFLKRKSKAEFSKKILQKLDIDKINQPIK